MQRVSIGELGDNAVGGIGPDPRIATGEITREEVEAFAKALATDEFYTKVGELRPNAAGGTFSLVIADALTTGRFMQPGDTAATHAERLYQWLEDNADTPENRKVIPNQCIDGRPVAPGSVPSPALIGGHDSTHGKDDCGAQKKLPNIIAFIAEHGTVLRDMTIGAGVAVDDETHSLIVANATDLLQGGYVSEGLALRAAFTNVAGEASVAKLFGEHGEVVGRRNADPTITLDRMRLSETYGTRLEAFNEDAGVFPAAAKVISVTEKEAAQKLVALEYYNTATTLVLADPSLRIIQ